MFGGLKNSDPKMPSSFLPSGNSQGLKISLDKGTQSKLAERGMDLQLFGNKKGNSNVGGSAIEGVTQAELPSTLNPKDVHFMQSSIKNQTGSHTVLENAEALRNGTLKPSDLPNVKVWKDDAGKIWTLDHRRLGAFKQAGLDEIPIQWSTPEEVASQMWKMTTKNGGTSIKLKLGNGESMIIK
ncbi:MAG: hypothetical protein E6942_16825 [Clostridium argentinense]|nr:hypothetical protein [Clostridium argentinense]